jgi:hypothetical protein
MSPAITESSNPHRTLDDTWRTLAVVAARLWIFCSGAEIAAEVVENELLQPVYGSAAQPESACLNSRCSFSVFMY